MRSSSDRASDAGQAGESASSGTPGKSTLTGRIQRRASGAAGGADGADAVGALSGAGGAPLPDGVRDRFESSLGADLGAVRVHTGSDSVAAAEGVGAQAFAVGNDIHFGAGKYAPDDPFGMHLLAHEVAHTQQQSGGAPGVQHKLEVSQAHDPLEHDADRAADAMVRGATAAVTGAGVMVQRAPDPAHQDAPIKDKKTGAKFAGPNHLATLDWDDPPALYTIAGAKPGTLRDQYHEHMKERLGTETLMVAAGLASMAPAKLGLRIKAIADESEPLIVGNAVKQGVDDAEPYRLALWRCAQRAIVDTLATEKSGRYQKKTEQKVDAKGNPYTSTTTYCNVYSSDMVNAMGGYLPRVWYNLDDLTSSTKKPQAELGKPTRDLSANEIADWLRKWGSDYRWTQVADPIKAQAEANSGRVVITNAAKSDAKQSGHVNVILAEGNDHAHTTAADGSFQPLQSQAGVHNYGFSDKAPKDDLNTPNWWDGNDPKNAAHTGMRPEPKGNFWVYEGAHQSKAAVGDATSMGKKT